MPKKAPQHFSSDLFQSQIPSKTSLPNVNGVPLDTSITLVGPWGRPGGHMVVGCQTYFPDFPCLKKIENNIGRWVIGPLNRRGSAQGVQNWSLIIFYFSRS